MRTFQAHHIRIITILILLAATLINVGCSSFTDKERREYADSLLNKSYLDIVNYSFVKAYKSISEAQII